MDNSQPRNLLATSVEFTSAVGRFYGIWATTEMAVDFAIGKLLLIPHEETHLITAGADFNRKARLLQALVKRKGHAKAYDIIQSLRIIQNESMRNTFAHSYLTGDKLTVSFVERSRHGNYAPQTHKFTLEEYEAHVDKLWSAGDALFKALGSPFDEMQAFAAAALKANSKEEISPALPSEIP